MSVKVYDATAERDGKFWVIHVPEVARYTQARNLSEVEAMTRSLISSMLDVDAGSFDVRVDVYLTDSVRTRLDRAAHLREVAAKSNSEAALEARRAAAEMAAQGMTLRDIGQVLGVSHQRAAQLVNS